MFPSLGGKKRSCIKSHGDLIQLLKLAPSTLSNPPFLVFEFPNLSFNVRTGTLTVKKTLFGPTERWQMPVATPVSGSTCPTRSLTQFKSQAGRSSGSADRAVVLFGQK